MNRILVVIKFENFTQNIKQHTKKNSPTQLHPFARERRLRKREAIKQDGGRSLTQARVVQWVNLVQIYV